MKYLYPAIFHQDEDGIWVEFPDLEGCHTYGDTLEEVFNLAKEALSGHLLSMIEEGIKVPNPTNITKIKYDKKDFVSLVQGDVLSVSKSVKKTLTIPYWLNQKAMDENLNFSKILTQALIQNLRL